MAKESGGKKKVEEASNLDAYTLAKNGGRHSGWYNQFKDKDESEICRGIRAIEKQMQEHQDKILNPRKYIRGFDSLTPQEQNGLVKRKWPKDIQRQGEQKVILQGILRERTVSDGRSNI
jgi:hypothetical protein